MVAFRVQLLGVAAAWLAADAAGTGDAESLIQTGLEANQGQLQTLLRESSLYGRMKLLAHLAAQENGGSFDCSKYPEFCKAPFNCQYGLDSILRPTVAKNGHANMQSWCRAPQYYGYMKTCMGEKKDLVLAAKIQYNWTIAQKQGIEEMDGSYCFIEGHCTNEAVTPNTTLAEAEQMCDQRYGHKGWAYWSPSIEEPRALISMTLFNKYSASPKTGFHDRKLTRLFLKMACAMGNYHCDVIYCKETYCKNPYYINKYKHLEPKTPGHLLKQRFGSF